MKLGEHKVKIKTYRIPKQQNVPGVIFGTIVLFKTARKHIRGTFKKLSSISLSIVGSKL